MPQPTDSTILYPPTQNCLARALYDNIAESPDELAFRKGDVLTVLEQNTANIEGWWLCSLRGRQGICPGNRLRLMPGVFDDTGQSREPSPQLTEIPGDLNSLQRQGKRRSWHVQPNKVLTPKKFNDVYLYDMPPSRCSPIPVQGFNAGLSPKDQTCESYDVPRAMPVSYDAPRNCPRCSPALSCVSPVNRDSGDSYDIPRPHLFHNQLTPSSSASSLTADSLSSSNRSSVANMPDYDIPKPSSRGPQLVLKPANLYDVPPTQLKELPLELSSALDTIGKLQSETTAAISKLLGFVSLKWRSKEKLEINVMEIKLAVMRLKTSLRDFTEFGEGTLGNAARASDKNLAVKLVPLLAALRNSDKLIQEACDQLQRQDWSVEVLSKLQEEDKFHKPDSLEQLVACARALTEDVRQMASFIQGNSTLLFKRSTSPQASNNNSDWHDDYDYVNLESKESASEAHAEIRNILPKELRKGYDTLVKNVDYGAINSDTKAGSINPDDRQVLIFFAAQAITYHNHLTQAIDAFLQTVEHNQPPRIFLAHGKFVVLSAHKLVHIGDTVHRNVSRTDIKARSLNCANALSEALATNVNKTKQAALQFPSVTAVQEMVDSVVDISHSARDIKFCLVQAAQPL